MTFEKILQYLVNGKDMLEMVTLSSLLLDPSFALFSRKANVTNLPNRSINRKKPNGPSTNME